MNKPRSKTANGWLLSAPALVLLVIYSFNGASCAAP